VYPRSPYAYPIGSFQSPVVPPTVPANQEPFLYIPINCAWFPYIAGALQQLLLQTTWDCDAETLVKIQGWVFDLIAKINCGAALTAADICGEIGSSGDDCMGCCLRFQDGKLQQLECGVWVDVAGQDGQPGPGGPGQPGAGSPQPLPGGGTAEYCFSQGKGESLLLPTTVSSGDILQFFKLDGAWNDSAEVIWNCPDGWIYALGSCGQTFPHGSPDLLPTALHMQLIVEINNIFYDALNLDFFGTPQTFVVPAGVSNLNVFIMPNIDDNSRIQGNVTYCVKVTNNQPVTAPWTQVFDFTATNGGFTPVIDPTRTPGGNGVWVTGVGWEATQSYDGATYLDAEIIERSIPATATINTMEMTYNLTKGTVLGGTHDTIKCDLSGTGGTSTSIAADTAPDGTSLTLAITPGTYSVNHFYLDVKDGFYVTGANGTSRITKLVITGTGINPFI